MAPSTTVLIVSLIATAVGLGLLITAAMKLDEVIPKLENCRGTCDSYKFWTAATSLGIIAGSVQILSFIAAWKNNTSVWADLQIFVCVLTIAAFGIGVDQGGFKGDGKTFVVFCLIDMIYTFVIAILVCMGVVV